MEEDNKSAGGQSSDYQQKSDFYGWRGNKAIRQASNWTRVITTELTLVSTWPGTAGRMRLHLIRRGEMKEAFFNWREAFGIAGLKPDRLAVQISIDKQAAEARRNGTRGRLDVTCQPSLASWIPVSAIWVGGVAWRPQRLSSTPV